MIKLIIRGIRKLYFHTIKNFRDVITVQTDFGPFRIYTRDKIVGYTLFKDRKWGMDFPREVFSFLTLHKLIEGKVTLIDMGAHIGITSIPFIKSGWIENSIAIEADRDNFKLLCENIILNNCSDRIFPLNYAVTEFASELVLEKSQTNAGDNRIRKTDSKGTYQEHLRAVTTVQGDSLPNLIKKSPLDITGKQLLIWIDIQGHEGYCFKGARDWLHLSKVIAIAEIWPYGIRRSGMSLEEFSDIVASIWSKYYIRRQDNFVQHSISDLPQLLEELQGDSYEDIILIP